MEKEITFMTEWVHPLQGQSIVFTGTLQTMTRSQAAKRAKEFGANVVGTVTMNTNFVVVGKQRRDKSTKQLKAEKYIQLGSALQIISEDDYLWLLSLSR